VTFKLKLDEEKSKHDNSTQQNGFGPTFLHSFLSPVKGRAKLNRCPRFSFMGDVGKKVNN
jgi:hypothetical protein